MKKRILFAKCALGIFLMLQMSVGKSQKLGDSLDFSQFDVHNLNAHSVPLLDSALYNYSPAQYLARYNGLFYTHSCIDFKLKLHWKILPSPNANVNYNFTVVDLIHGSYSKKPILSSVNLSMCGTNSGAIIFQLPQITFVSADSAIMTNLPIEGRKKVKFPFSGTLFPNGEDTIAIEAGNYFVISGSSDIDSAVTSLNANKLRFPPGILFNGGDSVIQSIEKPSHFVSHELIKDSVWVVKSNWKFEFVGVPSHETKNQTLVGGGVCVILETLDPLNKLNYAPEIEKVEYSIDNQKPDSLVVLNDSLKVSECTTIPNYFARDTIHNQNIITYSKYLKANYPNK